MISVLHSGKCVGKISGFLSAGELGGNRVYVLAHVAHGTRDKGLMGRDKMTKLFGTEASKRRTYNYINTVIVICMLIVAYGFRSPLPNHYSF